MYFVSLMFRYKVNTIDILLVFSTFDKKSIQVIVNIFFKFLKILLFNSAETIVDLAEF